MLTAGPGIPGFVYSTCQVLNAEVSGRQTHLERYNFDQFLDSTGVPGFFVGVLSINC